MATLAQFLAEAEALGAAAKGYSETLDGGTGPQYYDCSGLVQTSLKAVGISAPRTSEAQWAWAQHIPQSQLLPGDLVFANFPGEVSPGHVGVYQAGGNVYSARSTSSGIGTDTLASWGSAVVGYGRVPGIDAAGSLAGAAGTAGAGDANAVVLAGLAGAAVPAVMALIIIGGAALLGFAVVAGAGLLAARAAGG